MTSLANRLFAAWWNLHPLAQMTVILALGFAWVVLSAWSRWRESLRGDAERRGVER